MKILPRVHLLTCEARRETCAQTLQRWTATDWPVAPRVHADPVPERDAPAWGSAARLERLTGAFLTMLRAALAEQGAPGDWLLFLEDDLDFHPRLGSLVGSWEPLADPEPGLASLFNPSLPRDTAHPVGPRGFVALTSSFLGAQALLLRRHFAKRAEEQWPTLKGATSQRLAALNGPASPIWVHRPSLVQHVAADSSWGARVQRALDFDAQWVLKPLIPEG